MSQRSAQLARTRVAIVEAAAEFFTTERDPSEFTIQAIADRAGVSHRTVYRHFDDRQDLINAAAQFWEQRMPTPFDQASNFDEWISAIARVVAHGAAHREMLRRGNTISLATGVWRSDRDRRYWDLFRQRFPHLDESTARQDFALLRHVLGAVNVLLVGERFELSPAELTSAIERAVQSLVTNIAARDAAAGTPAATTHPTTGEGR